MQNARTAGQTLGGLLDEGKTTVGVVNYGDGIRGGGGGCTVGAGVGFDPVLPLLVEMALGGLL